MPQGQWFTDAQAREILTYNRHWTNRHIADYYDVSIKTVRDLRQRKTYWWVLPTTERPPAGGWVKARDNQGW